MRALWHFATVSPVGQWLSLAAVLGIALIYENSYSHGLVVIVLVGPWLVIEAARGGRGPTSPPGFLARFVRVIWAAIHAVLRALTSVLGGLAG